MRAVPSSRDEPESPLAYAALRALAQQVLRRWAARSRLGRTSLVHETFLRLAGRVGPAAGRDEQHWLAIAARAMRFVLVDDARRAAAQKRGGSTVELPADDALPAAAAVVPPARVAALGDALDELAAVDARRARIVELRAFGGLTVDEVAATLGVSAATVHREWPLAKAWLYRRLQSEAS
jgi:RNA polymerase sigma factor (TIGR02999 family)